jgi:alkaline phosphatase
MKYRQILYVALICMAALAGCHNHGNKKSQATATDTLRYTFDAPYETVAVENVTGSKVKNVILMIGEGMGLDQASITWVANRGKLNMHNLPYTGLMRTYAANRLITDSGAAGTAMATGQKTRYHSVGVDVQGNPLPSLTDLAKEKGLSTAVVVTCGLTDATPAAFCANNPDRDQEEAIALDYLTCGVDFIFGGGRKKFNDRTDKRDLMNEMKEAGYIVARTWDEVSAAGPGTLFAVLEDGQLPLARERGDLFRKASMLAIERLSQNPSGFFAMLEGSRIDDCGHWHDIPKLVDEIADFDQTLGSVLQWAEKDGQTLVIVLADHETGGLTLLDGDIKTGYVAGHFSTGGHSGILVPVYAYGPGAENFTGIFENISIFTKIGEIINPEQSAETAK